MTTRKVFDICDHGTHIIAIKRSYKSGETVPEADKYSPYRVYVMSDKWHKKQIAKCMDLLGILATAYAYIKEGG